MPKKRTFYSEEERKAHHEKKQREADLQIQELTKHWENDPKDIAEYLAFSTQVLQIFFTKHNADLPAAS